MDRICERLWSKLKEETRDTGSEVFWEIFRPTKHGIKKQCIETIDWFSRKSRPNEEIKKCETDFNLCLSALQKFIYNRTQDHLRNRYHRNEIIVYRGGRVRFPAGRLVPVTRSTDVATQFSGDIEKISPTRIIKIISKMTIPIEDIIVDVNYLMGTGYGFKEEKELLVWSSKLKTIDIGNIKVAKSRNNPPEHYIEWGHL